MEPICLQFSGLTIIVDIYRLHITITHEAVRQRTNPVEIVEDTAYPSKIFPNSWSNFYPYAFPILTQGKPILKSSEAPLSRRHFWPTLDKRTVPQVWRMTLMLSLLAMLPQSVSSGLLIGASPRPVWYLAQESWVNSKEYLYMDIREIVVNADPSIIKPVR